MRSPEDLLRPGHELGTADEVRAGDLVELRRVTEKRTELGVVRLTDLDGDVGDLYRVFPGPEGMAFLPVDEPMAEVRTWEAVREAGRRARARGSDWRRFGLPSTVIGIFEPGTEPPPKRRLEDIAMPAELREQTERILSAARKVPHPEEPVRALLGLQIEPVGLPIDERLELLKERLPVGAVVEITGLVSASPVSEPPLYAAGAYGAILDLDLRDAALLGIEEDEMELLLPMDCRCLVDAEPSVAEFTIRATGGLPRPFLRLTQIDSFSESRDPREDSV